VRPFSDPCGQKPLFLKDFGKCNSRRESAPTFPRLGISGLTSAAKKLSGTGAQKKLLRLLPTGV
jgi:hypothetical protein